MALPTSSLLMNMLFVYVAFMLCALVLLFNDLVELQTITTSTHEVGVATNALPLSLSIPISRQVKTISKVSGEVIIKANFDGMPLSPTLISPAISLSCYLYRVIFVSFHTYLTSSAPKIREEDITVLIKTMDRPKCLNHLVSSIRGQV
jgi:hypothetical protein